MIYITTYIVRFDNLSWTVNKTDDLPHEAIQIIFRLSPRSTKLQTISYIIEAISKCPIKWLKPINANKWLIDMDQLKQSFDKLKSLEWLKGNIVVSPEFNPNILKGDRWEPASLIFIISSFNIKIQQETKGLGNITGNTNEISYYMEKFSKDNADNRCCAFLMMKYEDTELHQRISRTIKETCKTHNIRVLRADDKEYAEDLLTNIRVYMHGCNFGIAVYERLVEDEFNPNVSLEVGYMMALKKPVCLLKDNTLKHLLVDLIGRLYREFDTQDPENSIPLELNRWLVDKGLINRELELLEGPDDWG